MVGASPISLKKELSAKDINQYCSGYRTDPVNQHMLANRYDFDTSLDTAVQASHAMVSDKRRARSDKNITPLSKRQPASQNEIRKRPRVTKIQSLVDAEIPNTNRGANQPFIPDHLEPIAVTTKKSPLLSLSYSELLDKCCFVSCEYNKTTRRLSAYIRYSLAVKSCLFMLRIQLYVSRRCLDNYPGCTSFI